MGPLQPTPRVTQDTLDRQSHFTYLGVMEVHYTPELQAKLDRVAADSHRGAEEYVQQLVEHYLDYDVRFGKR